MWKSFSLFRNFHQLCTLRLLFQTMPVLKDKKGRKIFRPFEIQRVTDFTRPS